MGNAQIANGGSFVNLTSPSSGSSSGQIIYKKSFKFLDSKSSKPIISFSSDFTFTITPGDGDGIAFVVFPSSEELSKVFDQGYFGFSDNIDHKFVAVEYDTRKDDNVGDVNGNHVGVDVGSFVSSDNSDVSSIGLLLNGGVPLKSWIDYEASSKRLEIRLAESGSEKPNQPLISHFIDLSEMWGDKEVLVGISSSNGNSKQVSSLSSWSFSIRTVPSSLHSQPLDPESHLNEQQTVPRRKNSFLTVLGALIFATGCGTLVAFVALFFWVIIFARHSNVSTDLPLSPLEFKYEKVNVTVDNASDDATN
ncbi:putative L-type lectin-domain containing receptor kinase S.7 [Bienertia sinuspersici]